MRQLLRQKLTTFFLLLVSCGTIWADDFTVERAVNLGQLDSWADISKFQWQVIDHGIQDNRDEMDALKTLFYDPAPKDTVGFYKQIYKARDNQYIVLRLDKAQGKRPFYVRVRSTQNTEDPSQNSSRLYAAENYAYIMPPIGETQLEVKIWPQGVGEEMAKTFTFNGHSYGSMSLRSVMLDKSRIVPGNYDLQLIHYDEETEKSDTSYIQSLVTDKLYTFYTYDKGNLVEAYMRCDDFKRIKLRPEWWAKDVVTHVNDNSVTVMSGPEMPFRQHKRLDAPNPTYLDSRLFSHHDTLWVSLFLDNQPSNDVEGLTIHAVRADFDNTPVGEQCLTWGKDPVSGRLYVLTDGEPATIECYHDGFLPKLCLYPGSYDHITGIISRESEEVDIYLEPIDAPITSPRVTSSILSSLSPTIDRRGDFYVCDIQDYEILHTPLNETVFYDEFASHPDTFKLAKGMMVKNYVQMEVAIVSPSNKNTAEITLKKAEGPEENNILNENLSGDTRVIYSHLFDYSYWATRFDLCGYLPVNKSGRPAVAFDGVEVRRLPILANIFLDLQELEKDLKKSADEMTDPHDAGPAAQKKANEVMPNGSFSLNAKIPLVPPVYCRWGVEADFVKTKKVTVYYAKGMGYTYDFVKDKSSNDFDFPPSITLGSADDYGSGDVSSNLWGFDDKESSCLTKKAAISASIEAYIKFGIPFSKTLTKGSGWGQFLFPGFDFVEETSLRAEANVGVSCSVDLIEMVSTLTGFDQVSKFFSKCGGKFVKEFLSPLKLTFNAGVGINASAGIFSFYNTEDDVWFWKNHIYAFKCAGQIYANAQAKLRVNLFSLASAEAGVSTGAGINFKYAAGCRMDFRNAFNGCAFSWWAGLGVYYKLKAFGWSKFGEKSWGRLTPELKLITPKNYKNPFHKNFNIFLSDGDEPNKSAASRFFRTANANLPGSFVTDAVDFNQPVTFIAGGDSIIYQGNYEDPNDNCVEVASTGAPIYLSDFRKGGCTDYDAASIPGTDLVVLEQATAKISEEDLTDSLHLDETVNRASRVYSIYYTKKKTGTKWYTPKPIYSSSETTSFRPRVALAENGTGVAIWQEGLIDKASGIASEDTVQLSDLVTKGQLMMSRFDGNETWSAPVPLMDVDENCSLNDYRVAYDGSTAFIVARRGLNKETAENICMTVDAGNNIAMHDMVQTNELMHLRRIGTNNVLAWATMPDSTNNTSEFRVMSYDMDGKPNNNINTSLFLNNTKVEDFRVVPDLEAKSLSNVAVLWSENKFINDSTEVRLMASRLVPNSDGSFGLGTPITAVRVKDGNSIYSFDGYMTKEKIQVCYVAVDSLGNSQLNKTATYFDNAFNYTVTFDTNNNQGFQCDKDEITLLVTVNNYGTSTINECVLEVNGKQYQLDMTIPAGGSAQERVTLPYEIGTGVNTTMLVKYDDVLGIQEQSYSRFMARRAARLNGNHHRSAEEKAEDATYEQQTQTFYPYHPRLECFVAAQHVHENGDNHITICVRNYARRKISSDFAYVVGLKENAHSPVVAIGAGEGQIQYKTKMIFNNPESVKADGGCMHDFGSYYAGYVTITVPNVTEKKEMYVGATLVYKDPKSGLYMQLTPDTRSFCKNGAVTLYPSAEAVSVKQVFNNDDEGTHIRVNRQGGNLLVKGAKPRQQVRLYQANGTIIARQQANDNGQATFSAPVSGGIGLVSTDNETVKFFY